MKSQNGWPVAGSEHVRKWRVPRTKRYLVLRKGDPGFVLTHFASWFNDVIEPLSGGEWDEWGWAVRDIRGSSTVSNHASGTAMDLNATKHPLGQRNTFSRAWKAARIKVVLRRRYKGMIRWGGTYRFRADEMHFEIVASRARISGLADRLAYTKRGKAVRRSN